MTWLDAGVLLGFLAICFPMLLLAHRPRRMGSSPSRHAKPGRARRRRGSGWRQNAAVLTALITALSGLATSAVALIRTDSDEGRLPSAGTPENCPKSRWFKGPSERS